MDNETCNDKNDMLDRALQENAGKWQPVLSLCIVVALTFASLALWIKTGAATHILLKNTNRLVAFLLPSAVVATALFVSFGLMVRIWRDPLRRKASPWVGASFLTAAVLSVLQAAALLSTILVTFDLYRDATAIDHFDNGSFTAVGPGRVVFQGTIGPLLLKDLAAVETTNGPTVFLQITSDGGLVDIAMALAAKVEAQGIAVTVKNYCMSACVAPAVASHRSFAEAGAIYGFHRTASVAAQISEYSDMASAAAEIAYFDYLRRHGVPERILQRGMEEGSEGLYEVTAAEMVDAGAIHGIVQGEDIIRLGLKK